jgi:hypothetical protein
MFSLIFCHGGMDTQVGGCITLQRNSAFEVLYSKCCSINARYPLCIHVYMIPTINKIIQTVTLWSSTSYHHSVNPEFNHLPYCTSVAFFIWFHSNTAILEKYFFVFGKSVVKAKFFFKDSSTKKCTTCAIW